MQKRLRDLETGPSNPRPLELVPIKKRGKLSKEKNAFYKKKSPIHEMKDLSVSREHFLYFKGNKYNPPKFLGNLIKIASLGFLIILIINLINVYYLGEKLTENISVEAYEGYNSILNAGKSATKIEFQSAIESFEKALANFEEAEQDLWFISTDQSPYSKNNDIGYAVNVLLQAGKHFAISGNQFLEALEEFNKIPLYFVSKNQNPNKSQPSITDTLEFGLKKINFAIEEIAKASDLMADINEERLPPEISLRVKFTKQKILEVSEALSATSEHFPAILKLLGDTKPHRYLILLQNNNEIRPTGGFIGSYGILEISEGYIQSLKVEDVYDLDDAYKPFIEPPEELKDLIPNWRLRDSNYSPDFPTSAKKIRWFLEAEGGPNIDTVIAINQGLLRDMLEITGPIQVGNFGKLNSENYNLLLSYIIEGKIWGAQDPKHILKVFVPAFKEAILQEKNLGKVGSKIFKAIQQKHILFYSNDPDVQNFFDTFGISGKVYPQKQNEDYLSVIHSSFGWNKSDQFIEETILHDTLINLDGSITNEITIKRTHKWSNDILNYWKGILRQYGFEEIQDSLIDVLGRGNNKVLTHINVPADSILLEANGADVATKYDKDLKKTYFSTVMETAPGESSELRIKYLLPFRLNPNEIDAYKIFIEKQPGSRGSIFTKTFSTHPDLEIISLSPQEIKKNNLGIIIYATNLVYDRYFAAALKK